MFKFFRFSEEEVHLHSSIAYGLEKKPPTLTSADWKQCKAVFTKYLNSHPISDVNETTRNLIEILEEFMEESKFLLQIIIIQGSFTP